MKFLLVFISLFIFIVHSLYGQKNSDFKNYKDTSIFIPQNEIIFLEKGKKLKEPYYFSADDIRKDMIVAETCSIPPSIADILYEYYYGDFLNECEPTVKQSIEEQLRKETIFCYIGMILINNSKSYIFMTKKTRDTDKHVSFYMLNIHEERLSSIFNIASYLLSFGTSYHNYTIIQSPNLLTKKSNVDVSDVILIGKAKLRAEAERKKNAKRYKLNKEGYIIPLKGGK